MSSVSLFLSRTKRRDDLIGFFVIAVAVVGLYAHTLQVPWYLDDSHAIVENPLLRDLVGCLRRLFTSRGVATFSFALNYRMGGLSLPGYHAVNIAIHLVSSWLVFLLLQRVVPGRPHLPLLGALIFAVHPLQTQAVTYVVQRMASLAALGFLLSLYCFVRARERLAAGSLLQEPAHLAYYLGSLTAGVLALFTKENTLVLPVALFLFARFFLPGKNDLRTLLKYLAPYLVLFSAIFAWLLADTLLPSLFGGASLADSTGAQVLASSTDNSPLNYFVTEFSVLWVYIRLLFIPFGQALDHSYPIVRTLLNLKSLVAFVALVGLGGLAYRMRRQRPLLSCGIAWFFLALAVESSFLPIDPLFEHRLYLPMFGFIMVVLDLVLLLPGEKSRFIVLGLLVLLLAPLTWSRNALWNDQIAFYESNLQVAPDNERVMSSLTKYYIEKGRYQEAEAVLLKGLRINPEAENLYVNLMKIYIDGGKTNDALAIIRRGLEFSPRSDALYAGLGVIHYQQGDYDKGIAYTLKALQFNPRYALGYANIGRMYFRQHRLTDAEAYFRQAISVFPDDPTVHNDLGFVLYQRQRVDEALNEYRTALRLDSNSVEACYRIGLISLERGDIPTARSMLARLETISPQYAAKLGNDLMRQQP